MPLNGLIDKFHDLTIAPYCVVDSLSDTVFVWELWQFVMLVVGLCCNSSTRGLNSL